MRLATVRREDGEDRLVAVVGVDDLSLEIVDLARASQGRLPSDLHTLLERGPAALAAAASAAASARERAPLASVELLPPVPRPSIVLAAALNYQAHVVEGGRQAYDRSRIVPKLFLKPPGALVGAGAAVILPTVSRAVDWEVELAAVIGVSARDVPPEHALEVVAGYSVLNDVSARAMDWGLADRSTESWDAFFDWLAGKWPDTFAPMGPWLVTADEIPDPQALALELRLNGEVRQSGSTADMIFTVGELVSHASRFMTLRPGDVVATGTPSGVGDATRRYLVPGDVMVGRIDRIGEIRTPVVAAATPAITR